MVLFQLMATQGLSHAVRESLEGLVQWDVAVLHEVNLLEAHERVCLRRDCSERAAWWAVGGHSSGNQFGEYGGGACREGQ